MLRLDDDLGARRRSQLAEQVADVVLDGVLRQVEFSRDVAVAPTLRQRPHDLELAGREQVIVGFRGVNDALCLFAEGALTLADLAQPGDEFFGVG